MSASRHPGRRRAGPGAHLLLALAVLLTVLGGAGAPAVASPAVDDDATGEVELRITQVAPGVVRPEDEVVVRATVHNGTREQLTDARATLRVSRFLQSTRSAVDRWASLPPGGTTGTEVAPAVPLPGPLAPGQSVEITLRAPAADLRLSTADSAWGPRGLSVVVTAGGRREAVERTFLLWRPTEQSVTPTRVSVLVPVTGGPVDPTATDADASAPPAGQPDTGGAPGSLLAPTAGAPTDLDLARLDAILDATADHPGVTWAVDPALVTAARATADGSEPRRWVDALTDAADDREVLALPARDPDLAALAHADSAAADAILTEALAAAGSTVDPLLGPTPRTDLAWPADASPDLDTAILAARSGASSVLVDGAALPPEGLTYTPTGRATLDTAAGPVDALVTDPVLSAQLEDSAGTTPPTPATAAQRVLAETAVVTRERPNQQRHLLLAVDRGWEPQPDVAAAQLAALADAPWVDLSPVSTLAGTEDPAVDRPTLPGRDVAEREITPGRIAALQRARGELARFASIVPDPAALLAGVDDAVRVPLAVAWRTDPVQRAAVVDGLVGDLTTRRSGVSVVAGSDLYLISEASQFPLGLRNDLAQEATVRLAIDPAGSLLVIDEQQTVTIPPESETQVRVPFHAVGSGDVRVTVSLLAADGTPLGPPEQFTVRVRADWENVGTAVVAGLLGLALVIGIIRTIRRGQTAQRGAGTTPVSEIARLPEESP